MKRRYRDRISGPIRDRIDLHRTLVAPGRPDLARALSAPASSAQVAVSVADARGRQQHRLADSPWRVNADVPGVELRKRWPVDDDAATLVDARLRSQRLSPRAADRVLRVAWTVADLRGHDRPVRDDVELAIALRGDSPLPAGLDPAVAAS